MNTFNCKNYDEIYNIPNKNGMYINDKTGDKYTFKNNKLHSYNDNPAGERIDGHKIWFRNGIRHRLYGPAVEWSYGSDGWYLFGRKYSEDAYNEIMKNVPLFYWLNRDKL
jgi:hypothetical protein